MTRGGYTSKYGRFGFGKISSRYIPYIDPSLDVFFLVFFFLSALSLLSRESGWKFAPEGACVRYLARCKASVKKERGKRIVCA